VDPAWIDALLSPSGRRTWEAAIVDLAAGFAFTGPTTSTAPDLVDAAYESITGRFADSGGAAYWTPKVQAAGPRKLAASLVRTTAHRGRAVDSRYLQIVGRLPDPAGRTYWIGRLGTDGGEQALMASLLATESFRTAATH